MSDAIEKLQLELYYIKNMSLLLDLFIILKTVKIAVFAPMVSVSDRIAKTVAVRVASNERTARRKSRSIRCPRPEARSTGVPPSGHTKPSL